MEVAVTEVVSAVQAVAAVPVYLGVRCDIRHRIRRRKQLRVIRADAVVIGTEAGAIEDNIREENV